ncbi:uncharacterized protein LOC141714581 [Apium graveolens]|uniref:uncharacterized protein LOC141714581 n=1 Tax=Apium graveolens TaxID=4045 RepID=UPI003D7A3404
MLYLEDTIRIEMLEEEEAMDTIVQTDFNGERLEGRIDVLQSLEQDDALPPEEAPLPAKHTKEVDVPAMQGAPSKEVDAPPKGDAPSLQDNEIRDSPDLYPQIPMPMEKMGPAEDTIEIPVDEKIRRQTSTEPDQEGLALNRFVSKSDRCKNSSGNQRKGKDFLWTSECEEAFLKIKEQLGNPPMLAKPEDRETLILYLAVSEYSVSAVLVNEEEHQWPIYYVSKRLLDTETRYTNMEKLVYALLAARKLRPYFQAYRIEVRTAYPLRHILHKLESSGRMLKWVVELGQFDLEYCPCTAIKGQALADFILEFDAEVDDKAIVLAEPTSQGSSGIVLVTPEGHRLMSAIHFKFYATNNDVEYEALINGLKLALEKAFREKKNSNADALAKMGSQMDSIQLGQIPLGIPEIPSIPEVEVLQMQEVPRENWMTPIHNYIQTGVVPEDKLQARRLRYQAAKYVEYDGILYKRGFNQPLLRCMDRRRKLHSQRGARRDLWQSLGGGVRFANYSIAPTSTITSLASPWPFAMWEIDLWRVSQSKRGCEIRRVAVDYFTKWAEAMPLATITEKKIRILCSIP